MAGREKLAQWIYSNSCQHTTQSLSAATLHSLHDASIFTLSQTHSTISILLTSLGHRHWEISTYRPLVESWDVKPYSVSNYWGEKCHSGNLICFHSISICFILLKWILFVSVTSFKCWTSSFHHHYIFCFPVRNMSHFILSSSSFPIFISILEKGKLISMQKQSKKVNRNVILYSSAPGVVVDVSACGFASMPVCVCVCCWCTLAVCVFPVPVCDVVYLFQGKLVLTV